MSELHNSGSPIISIHLAVPPVQIDGTITFEESWLLSSITKYPDLHIMAASAPGMHKHESLGRIFSDLTPSDDGCFLLELGVILPDLLPILDNKLDNIFIVKLDDGSMHKLVVSNQMAKVNYLHNNEGHHAIFPRHGENDLRAQENKLAVENASLQLLKTTASIRFLATGVDADDALESNIQSCSQILVSCLNKLLGAHQKLGQEHHSGFSILYDKTSFECLYLVMRGKDKEKYRTGRMATHLGRVALHTPNISNVQAKEIRDILSGTKEIDLSRRFLATGVAAAQSGVLQFALLQLVISSEMATAHYVRRRLFESGISQNKWDSYKTDINYSQMLNIYLQALTPANRNPEPRIIGLLNNARKLRNALMHEGKATLNYDRIIEIAEATKQHLDYLESLP